MATFKLKPAVKTAWLAALRSGDYQQGRFNLRRSSAFCCLGVLCDLAAKDGIGTWKDTQNEQFTPVYGFTVETSTVTVGTPPHKVAMWADLHDTGAWFGTSEEDITNPAFIMTIDTLVQANDSGKTFAEIADMIEENW